MGKMRLVRAVGLFLEAEAARVSPPTLAFYRHYLTRFVNFAGDVELARVTPALLRRFSTRWHPCIAVRRLFNWAKRDARIIAVNPIEGMRIPRHGARRRVLSRLERVRLLRACGPAFRCFAVAMVETIARPREIRGVRWGDIRVSGSPHWSPADLAAGLAFFWIEGFKGQDRRRDEHAGRAIPISPRLGRILVRLWGAGRGAGETIFCNARGEPWTTNAVRCQFRRLRDRAGVVADVRGERATAYTLRHTAATDAVGAGVVGFTLAELMGHSDIRMTQRYVHLRPDHLIAAANQIAEWKKGFRRKNDRTGSLRKRPDDAR